MRELTALQEPKTELTVFVSDRQVCCILGGSGAGILPMLLDVHVL